MRAIGRPMSHSSSASTGQITMRTPLGNLSGGRLSIGEYASRSRGCMAQGAFGPVLMYQSAICAPVQNSTSFFLRIFWKIWRKYLARCGAPMM